MTKFTSALLACLLCSSAAFGFDPIDFIKKTVSDEGDVTAGFDRNNRLGVVKDDVYKLMWQDGKEIYQGTYDEAQKYCKNLTFVDYDDWRLPTINELLSITDDTRFEPAINKAFKNVAYETSDKGGKSYSFYWSSTKYANGLSGAWIVSFWNGGDGWDDVSNRCFVRCVRDY